VRSVTISRVIPFRLDLRARAIPYALWIALALAFAAIVRLRPFVTSDWPLNDGGMFVTAVSEILRNRYALPTTLEYNGLAIPFAYPPLAFYVAALVSDLGRVPLTDVFRALPLFFSWLSVVAFHRVARRLLRDQRAVIAATFAFGVVPSGWVWMVMGGGLTRALGLTFLLFALGTIFDVFARPTWRGVLTAGALSAAALLTHLEFAWALAFSAGSFWVTAPTRRRLRSLVAIGAVAIALASPWLAIVIARHGVAPFVAAAQTGQLTNPLEQLLAFRQSGEPNFPLFAALALLGAIIALVQRSPGVLAWTVAIALLDPRSWGTLSAVPLAILAARGAIEGVGPFLASRTRVAVVLGMIAIGYLVHGALISQTTLLASLSPDERAAMAWVAVHTPNEARVAVLSERGWADDREAEWFPVLADRVSVATAQGVEWLPGRAFWQRLRSIEALEECGTSDGECLETWSSDHAVAYDYVFLPKYPAVIRPDGTESWCCMGLRTALRVDPRFTLVYDGPGATIYERSKR
jgi:hypothetical protein